MRTVGQILKETRENKNLDLEAVERATKIRKELLIALENDEYSKLPPATFVQGFIKNYSKYLGLDSNKLLAVFRRGFEQKKYLPYVMDAFSKPVEEKKIVITPTQILATVIVLIILSFFGYLWLQYRQFIGAPNLTISSPTDQMTTANPTITVGGATDPEAKVTVNNQEIPVGQDGKFQEDLTLSSEVNKLSIVAVSKFGKQTEQDLTVYLKK